MLLRHNPLAIDTLRTRFTSEFLPLLATSRTNSNRSQEHRVSLPGLGSEYWSHARAHLFCGTMPPKFSNLLISPSATCEAEQIKDYLDMLYPIWNIDESAALSKIIWEEAEVEIGHRLFPLIRIPVRPIASDRYQNGSKIKSKIKKKNN